MLASQVESRTIPQFVVAPSTDVFFHPEQLGDPTFNFLLRKDREPIEISEEAHWLVQENKLHPLLAPMVQININGGVMGEKAEAEGWGNIKNHLLMAQQFVEAGGKVLRFPFRRNLRTQAAALTHDCDTRFTKESLPRIEVEVNGIRTLMVDQHALFAAELTDAGPSGIMGLESIDPRILAIAGVTHADFRRSHLWTPQQKLMRLGDSSIGSTRAQNGGYIQDQIMHPEERVEILKNCKPIFDELGRNVYDGMSTFDKWLEVTQNAEIDLRLMAEETNAPLLWCYFNDNREQKRLGDLIGAVMSGRVTPPNPYI